MEVDKSKKEPLVPSYVLEVMVRSLGSVRALIKGLAKESGIEEKTLLERYVKCLINT